jgi:hypothetical protein
MSMRASIAVDLLAALRTLRAVFGGRTAIRRRVRVQGLIRSLRSLQRPRWALGEVILPPQNVSLSKAVLMRKGGEDDEVKAGTLHA